MSNAPDQLEDWITERALTLSYRFLSEYGLSYAPIPMAVLFNEHLTDFEKILYAFLNANQHRLKNTIDFTNRQLCELLGKKDTSTISGALSNLKNHGLIDITSDENGRSIKILATLRFGEYPNNFDEYVALYRRGAREKSIGGLGKNPQVKEDPSIFIINNKYTNKRKNKYNNKNLSFRKVDHHLSENSERCEVSSMGSKFKRTIDQKLPKKIEHKNHPLLDYWNSLPCVPKHKDVTTKRYKEAVKLIHALQAGKLGSDKFPLDQEFLDKHKIHPSRIGRKVSDTAIKQWMDKLDLCFTHGFWPKNKDKLPKSLADLIYSSTTVKSWYFILLNKVPKALSEYNFEKKVKHNGEDFSTSVQHLAEGLSMARYNNSEDEDISTEEKHQLIDVASKIHSYYEDLPKIKQFEHFFPDADSFVKDYSEWLRRQYEGFEGLAPRMLGPGTKTWDKYIKFAQKDLGVSFEDGRPLK
jgi:hypothetical protein